MSTPHHVRETEVRYGASRSSPIPGRAHGSQRGFSLTPQSKKSSHFT